MAIKEVSGILFYPQITPPLPMALMGRDLLAKLQISINCPSLDPISILCIQMAPEPLASPHSQNLPLTDPQVWDSEASLVAHSPEQVFLKNPSGNNPNSIYPDHKILTKIKPIISRLLKSSLLWPICSPYNTPISSVQFSSFQSLSRVRLFATP